MRLQADSFNWHARHTYRKPSADGLNKSIHKIGKALETCTCPDTRRKLEGLLDRQILKAATFKR